jgi:hypothetical protein
MSSSTSPEGIRRLVHELYAAWSLHQLERIDAIFTGDAAYEDVLQVRFTAARKRSSNSCTRHTLGRRTLESR